MAMFRLRICGEILVRKYACYLKIAVVLLAAACKAHGAETLDLSKAVVYVPEGAGRLTLKAAMLLSEEVERRTQVRWPLVRQPPSSGALHVAVAVWQPSHGDSLRPPQTPEAYRLQGEGTVIRVLGTDDAGAMFGVGRLLRLLAMSPGRVAVETPLQLIAAPAYPLRGHQLGYRPKTNSYDAWDEAQWERYYRDLVVFGSNAIELVPPRTDDDEDSPHFPLPPLDMMARMSQLADDYGLAVWIWYPAMDRDYADPATVEFALREWGEVFAKLPRIDAVFVPGGDPGHTQPRHLLALLEKQAAVLQRTHPRAQMWVSPQSFSQAWLDEFLALVKDEPKWLAGLVFGPQVRISLPQLRAAVPERYPIRHYPDITHSRQCQYPVHQWDRALAFTHGRECINPRPVDQAAVYQLLQPFTNGFLTYSEGCNDDVNKFVWSGLAWQPQPAVIDVLRDYAAYFIGAEYRDSFAQGLLALERNWRSPPLAGEPIQTTLAQFQDMERSAGRELLEENWRFQMALYRAYYDASVLRRLLTETEREAQAIDCLRNRQIGAEAAAIDAAERLLDVAPTAAADDLTRRTHELADALFKSIRLQSSVERYQAIAVGRGASLDTLDYPLSNAPWLKTQFRAIRRLGDAAAQSAALDQLVNWTNPGPGGFYDDLGRVGHQPHLVVERSFAEDPASLATARTAFAGPELVRENEQGESNAWRTSWLDHAESLVDAPLTMRYTDLDPTARYVLRVVYAGDGLDKPIRCEAEPGVEIHPFRPKPKPIAPIEFEIPAAATQGGTLTLRWYRKPGIGDNGRGCQVSEVWLSKRRSK